MPSGKVLGEGCEWEVGVSRFKLLYTEWINKSYYLHLLLY